MSSHGDRLSYVVSRSGKVLDSSGRVLQEIVPANVPDLSYARPLASLEGQPESFFNFAAFLLAKESAPPVAAATTTTRKRKFRQRSKTKLPTENRRTLVWEDDINSSLDDIARAILRRDKHKRVRRSSRKKPHAGSENNTGGYTERHRRLVQHLRVGVSQMFILQRWQPGSRELPAKWASWLLKMLRKAKPAPQALQKFLFTVLVAILPVISCGLVCQTLSILPDSEVLRAVDILCGALEKSWSCFSAFQWEILEERIHQCQQVRLRAGTWSERRTGGTRTNLALLPSTTVGPDRPRYCRKVSDSRSISSSSDDYGMSNDEQMSNELVHSEGVKSLVRRALRERQILSYKRSEILFTDNNNNNNSQDGGTAVSTVCPLSGMRLKIPARGIYCTHLTCFDLECYLETNAEMAFSSTNEIQSRMWRCPFCGSDATWPQIIVDGLILRILKSLPRGVDEVLIWRDGRWGAKEPLDSIEQAKQENSDQNSDSSAPENREESLAFEESPENRAFEARNVRPRLSGQRDVSQADESTWDAKEITCAGGLLGNKESAGKQALCDETVSSVDLPHKAPNKNMNSSCSGPLLHEIDLRGLIQSTLEKSKQLNSCSSGRKADVFRAETLSVSWR